MNEDYNMKIISTRLRVLEDCLVKIQHEVGRLKNERSNNENSFYSASNETGIANTPFGKEIRFVEFDGGKKTNVSTFSQKLFSRIQNNFGANKSSLKNQETSIPQEHKMLTPICLIGKTHSWLYNVLFVLVNFISLIISCIYINNAYNTWQSSPVVQALSNNQIHFENISFPAVTICFPNSFKEDYDFFSNVEGCLNSENNTGGVANTSCNYTETATLALANLMCPKYGSDNPLVRRLYENVPRAIDRDEFDTYMERLFPACESDVVTIQLSNARRARKNHTRCDGDVFQQFYSYNNNRLCMTYNGLPHEDIFEENVATSAELARQMRTMTNRSNLPWSFDSMMDFKGDLHTTPIYGMEGFLIVIHKQKVKYKNICTHLSKDLISVIVHSPNEIPMDFDGEIEHMIRKNVMFDLLVVPKITLARDDLAQYPPQQRGCLFAHERKLNMFKLYTKNNCEVECIVNLFLNTCGCVPYFYPRPNASVKVCLRPCARPKYRCDCLPDCNHLTYDMITQEVPVPESEKTNSTPRAFVQVMLKGKTVYTTIRYSITSFAEFLAYSLGVLGVFIGFSVTCMWRLLYFVAARLLRTVKIRWHKAVSPLP